jgi:hypothetical protein
MDLRIIAGFLGSGKTTMVLSVIDEIFRRDRKRVVIIANDFGSIGIDGKVMDRYGLKVKKMPSGCVCCTLGNDLLTLKYVANPSHPQHSEVLRRPLPRSTPAGSWSTSSSRRAAKIAAAVFWTGNRDFSKSH